LNKKTSKRRLYNIKRETLVTPLFRTFEYGNSRCEYVSNFFFSTSIFLLIFHCFFEKLLERTTPHNVLRMSVMSRGDLPLLCVLRNSSKFSHRNAEMKALYHAQSVVNSRRLCVFRYSQPRTYEEY
jgi:hypothetical protein